MKRTWPRNWQIQIETKPLLCAANYGPNMDASEWVRALSVAKAPCQRRKHVKSRFLWVGKRRRTSMAEFITSTTTRKRLLGSIRETGEWSRVGVVKRSHYGELTPMFNYHLPRTQAAICFILKVELSFGQSYGYWMKQMVASLCLKGLWLRKAVLCVNPCELSTSINAIFMEFTHFWRLNELSGDRSSL